MAESTADCEKGAEETAVGREREGVDRTGFLGPVFEHGIRTLS